MHDRSNGLGGGFAAYGIYPEHKDEFALHIFFGSGASRHECEAYLKETFEIVLAEEMPIRIIPEITDVPIIRRYFVTPLRSALHRMQLDEREYIARAVMHINTEISDAYVFSSGKNCGVFKAIGFPEDVGLYYRLEEYEAYSWTAHGRYPTNTPGWWGGAHPFAMLDFTIVHNGEISSYDANRRSIEMHGYKCDLLTDTEAITYIFDYLIRRKGLTLEEAAHVVAAPFWSTIEKMPPEQKAEYTYLRDAFAGLLINGPFSIMLGFTGGIMALNDRLKLRSMVVGEKGEDVYIASEEAAIRVIQPELDKIWAPRGGEPVIVTLNEDAQGKE